MSDKQGELDQQGWRTSLFTQTTEEVARAVVAAAAAVRPRPSIVFSANNTGSNKTLQKLQRQLSRVWNQGFAREGNKKGFFNPEHLTSQKRQWTKLQVQLLERKQWDDPNCMFEHMVVVGIHPETKSQTLEAALMKRRTLEREPDAPERLRDVLRQQLRGSLPPLPEPQILFAYPPGKRLPMRQKDLLAFCFPGGLEAYLVERTPSLSELNEIVYGQDHLMRDDLSYTFVMKVADNATLYGVCIYVPEIVQQPPGIMAMDTDVQLRRPPLSRFFLTAYRCYCLLTKLPFFGLHFDVLNSIISQERLDRITECVNEMTTSSVENSGEDMLSQGNGLASSYCQNSSSSMQQSVGVTEAEQNDSNGDASNPLYSATKEPNDFVHDGLGSASEQEFDSNGCLNKHSPDVNSPEEVAGECSPVDELSRNATEGKVTLQSNGEAQVVSKTMQYEGGDAGSIIGMRLQRVESVDSVNSMFGSFGQTVNSEDDEGAEEASCYGPEHSPKVQPGLVWAEVDNYPLRILHEYHKLSIPARGDRLDFQPLEHLQPLRFTRYATDSSTLLGGRTIDLKLCRTSLEAVEMHAALNAAEEALALSIWTVATLCRVLSLENVLALFAGVMLEKQIIVICPNLGVLSAVVLSTIPLIRPFQWQSLILPILPNQMLDFLDAPVPYIVGVKHKSSAVRAKSSSVVLVNAQRDKVTMPYTPQLPHLRELISALEPYHSKLSAEVDFAKRHPVHMYNDAQSHAAEGFLAVLRSYLESLCGNLRSHTITNVQSNDDKVSLLLKESFVEDFQQKDHPFMKLFVDTQLFAVHTDVVLSFIESD